MISAEAALSSVILGCAPSFSIFSILPRSSILIMRIVWSHNFQASSTHKDPLLACGNTHSKQGVHFFETLITRFHRKCVCSVKFNHLPNQNHSSSSLTTKYGQSSLRFLEITHQHGFDRCWFHRLVLSSCPAKRSLLD